MAGLESLLERLVRGRVQFVVVGGYAAVAHGATLVTQDVDICCRFSPENLLRLQGAVAGLHSVHRMTPRRLPLALTEATCRGLKNLYLDTDLGQLDCLGSVLGIGDFDKVLKRSTRIKLPFGFCRILGLDALIVAKEAMDRPRDRAAVTELKALRSRRSR
jgi:hypothetical protein